MVCEYCKQTIEDDAVFCPNCGHKKIDLNDNPQYIQPSQPIPQPVQPAPQFYQPTQFNPQNTQNQVKKKRKLGCLITFLIVFVVTILTGTLLVYFFVPGLLKPKNLGIKSSQQAYLSAMKKLNMTKDDAPTKGSAEDYKYEFGSLQSVDASLSSEEITSFFNENRPPYYAVKNVQIRVNKDNTIEAVGTADTKYIFENILDKKYSKEELKSKLPMIGLIPDKANFYIKMSGGIKNNRAQKLEIEKVNIMGIKIPMNLVNSSEATSFMSDTIGNFLDKVSSNSKMAIEELKMDNGNLIFKGQLPSSIKRVSRGTN